MAVTGFVRDDRGRVLLVRVAARGWEMPGGQVEQGEGVIDALQREVAEEAGCVVRAEQLLAVESRLSPPEMLLLLFACRHVSGAPRARELDVPEVGWFTPDEARRLVARSPAAERLALALSGDPGVRLQLYRTHPYEQLSETRLE